jgi:2-C-methyl-D-erythritol 2,4-cyclodiphosphate synthase
MFPIKVGIGYDSHPFVNSKPLFLGGIKIPYTKGLSGHSDGDVILHAIIDSILTPATGKNIGELFSDKDSKYKNISSLILLKEAFELIKQYDYKISNIDVVYISESPIIQPYIPEMITTIAKTIHIDSKIITIKGKSNEKMGFVGRNEGAAVIAVSLLYS